jgi:hypothetical protein
MDWGFNSPSNREVYFSDWVSLVRTLGNKLEQGWDGVEIAGDPFGELPELSWSCPQDRETLFLLGAILKE